MPSVGPIQGIATGLLSLLQLKQFGRNPDTLASEVVPQIDLREWYLISQAEVLTGVLAGANALQNWYSGLTVPPSEVWYVHSMHMRATLVGGESINANLGFAIDRGLAQPPLHIFVGQPNRGTLGVPGIWELGAQPRQFFPPNTIFGANVYAITTAAQIELTWELLVTRLKA